MRPNCVDLKKCDTIVTMNVEEMAVEVDFQSIRDLYLTPMEAILYSMFRKYAGETEDSRKFLKIAHSDLLLIFRHLDGRNDIIERTIESLIEKRLIIEGQDISQLLDTNDLGEIRHFYHCL
jgi:hypothetical protein